MNCDFNWRIVKDAFILFSRLCPWSYCDLWILWHSLYLRCVVIHIQIGRSYVISKLKDYPKFQAVAIAIQRSGFKVWHLISTFLIIILSYISGYIGELFYAFNVAPTLLFLSIGFDMKREEYCWFTNIYKIPTCALLENCVVKQNNYEKSHILY